MYEGCSDTQREELTSFVQPSSQTHTEPDDTVFSSSIEPRIKLEEDVLAFAAHLQSTHGSSPAQSPKKRKRTRDDLNIAGTSKLKLNGSIGPEARWVKMYKYGKAWYDVQGNEPDEWLHNVKERLVLANGSSQSRSTYRSSTSSADECAAGSNREQSRVHSRRNNSPNVFQRQNADSSPVAGQRHSTRSGRGQNNKRYTFTNADFD